MSRYPEDNEGVKRRWSHDGYDFTIVECCELKEMAEVRARFFKEKGLSGDEMFGPERWYCGYVRFERRPVKEEHYNGILTYVPVHSGITYAEQDQDGSMVYGFDCHHSGDENKPETRDLEWVGQECFKMARAIEVAAKYEDRYLAAGDDNALKALVLGEYHGELGMEFELTGNLGAMMNVLFGKL